MNKPARRRDIVHDAAKSLEAATVLKDQLRTLCGDDPDFLRDSVEGEIDLESIVSDLVASIGEDKATLEGLKLYRDRLKDRAERINARVEAKRALLASALQIADRPSIDTVSGTVSTTPVQPRPIVLTPADIPAEYWRTQPPVLDLPKLTEAMTKDGKAVPGVVLSNGGTSIRITRS
jgi:hypothetical protein